MEIPQYVIDYCNKFTNCKGCKFSCVAPLGLDSFNDFIKDLIERVRNEME